MSDDTPTQRFDAPLTPTTPLRTAPEGPTPEETRRRRLMIVLITLSAVLLAALLVVLIVLVTRSGTPTAITTPSQTPSVSATPSATPSPTPLPTTPTKPSPPPPAGPTLTSFASSTDVQCNAANNPIPLDFSWVGTGATAYIAVGTTNDPKSNGQGWSLPPTGTQADFPAGQEILYPCTAATATFTIGVYDNSGASVVKQLVVTNHGTVG
jgi:hypothetical protein